MTLTGVGPFNGTLTLSAAGQRNLYVRLYDTAGNPSALATATVCYIPPAQGPLALTPTLIPGNGFSKTTAIKLVAPAAGQNDLQITGAGLAAPYPYGTTTPPGTQVPLTLTAGDGAKAFAITYRDLADNTAGPINLSITLDATAPPIRPVTVSGALADGTASTTLTATTTVTLDLTQQTDLLSGPANMKISNQAGLGDANWQPFVSSNKVPWTLAPGDGAKTVYVAIDDNAGNDNVATPSTGTITLKTQPPTAPALSLASKNVNSQAGYSDSLTVRATVNAAGTPTSVTLSENPNFSGGQNVSLGGQTLPYSIDFVLAGTGNRTVYARFYDSALNYTPSISTSIIVRTTPPGTLAPTLTPSGFTPGTAIQLTPPAAGEDFIQLTGVSVVAPAGFVPVTAGAPINVTLSSGDGVKTINVTYRDNAGNTTVVATPLSITLEATAPAASNFTITGTFADGSQHVGSTVTQTVTLNLGSEVDAVSGTPLMRLGLLPDVSDGAWQSYAASPSFVVPSGDGLKTVYAQFQNGVGKTSAIVQGTVTLSTTASISGTASFEGAAADLSGTAVSIANTSITANSSVGGGYALSGIPYGAQTLVFTRPGFDAQQFQISLSPGQSLTFFAVSLAASRGSVTGSVSATGAADQSGTVVNVSGGPDTASTVTDSAGNFTIPKLRVGTGYSASFTRAAYTKVTSAPFAITSGAVTPLLTTTLTLSTAGSIAGTSTVARPAGGSGGIAVSLTGVDINGAPVVRSTSTAANGAYSFSGLVNGTYSLSFSKANYDPQQMSGVVVAGNAATAASVVLQVSTGTIAGTVALSASTVPSFNVGTDFSGAVVTLSGTDVPVPSAVTDATG